MKGIHHFWIGCGVSILVYLAAMFSAKTVEASSFWAIFNGYAVGVMPDVDILATGGVKYHRSIITHSALIPVLFFFFAPVGVYAKASFCLIYASHLWADLLPSDFDLKKIGKNLRNLDAPGAIKPAWANLIFSFGFKKDGISLSTQALIATIFGLVALLA